MVGSTISHYKILEKLGEGGMGVVYKAQDTKLNRTVALKFLPEHISASESDTARFIQEAQAAASLNHPNICTIHGIEESESKHFIVMEFVDGQTLGEKKSSLSLKQAVDIGVQIADGLAAAHDKGITHRDIKPDNIMIRKDGIVQIMDFGLAKLRGATNLTQQGSTVGTARYMSPEQVQGSDIDHRSDIFSLGVLLYELFSGQLPFRGVHETALMYEIVNVDPEPMSTAKTDIPPELDAIVFECLAKEKTDRYQSAAEVAKELRRHKRESGRSRTFRTMSAASAIAQSPHGAAAEPTGSRARIMNRERLIWGGVLMIVLAISAIAFLGRFSEQQPEPLSIRFTIQPPENSAITQTVVSPDGKMIAFTATGVGKTLLWTRPMNGVSQESIPGTEDGEFPFWSPDSRFLGFFANGKLKKVAIAGGTAIELCDAPQPFGGSWSIEDEIIFSSLGGLFRIPAQGGQPKQVIAADSTANQLTHRWPEFLPDGKRFLFMAFGEAENVIPTYIASLRDPAPKAILKSPANVHFAPPSHLLILRGRTLMSQEFDLDEGKLVGEPRPIAVDVGYVPLLGLGDFSYSRAGILTTGGGRAVNREYRWVDRSGKSLGSISAPGNYFDVALSPSGSHAAVQRSENQTASSDIWIIDITRGVMSRFTFDPAVDDDPVWGPDGKYVYFTNTGSGNYRVYRKLASGLGGPEEVTSSGGNSEYPSSISTDGRYMLYFVGNRGAFDIWVMELEGGKRYPFIATPFDETFAEFSPDSKWVVYSSNESGRYEVYVRSFSASGGRWQISSAGGSQPHWRQDGRELFYVAPDLKLMSVGVRSSTTLGFDTPTVLFQTRMDMFDGPKRYAVAENGRKFLINIPVGEEFANPVTVTINPDM